MEKFSMSQKMMGAHLRLQLASQKIDGKQNLSSKRLNSDSQTL